MPSEKHVSTIHCPESNTDQCRKATVLILLADTPVPSVREKHGDYHDVFTTLFQRSLASYLDELQDIVFTIKSYDVVNEPWEYPKQAELDQASALLITGSAASAYEDKPWINRLTDFTAAVRHTKPKLKLVGICYGHQIIARALGGQCEPNSKGWELGVRSMELTDIGKRLLQRKEARDQETVTIHQVHRDHVPVMPPDFACLGSTTDCAIHGMVYPKDSESLSEARILTLQGHPEFSPDIVTKIIDVREEKGILTKELADKSRQYAALHDDGIYLGAVILRFISQGGNH